MSTRDEIRRYLSSALNRTLAERSGTIITTDTLYALIRRLKLVLKRSTDLTIDSERDRAYVLKCKAN